MRRVASVPCIAILALWIAPPASADFVVGVNFGGGAVTVDGNLWQSESDALSNGLSWTSMGPFDPFVYATTPVPAVDAATATMLNDVRYLTFGTSSVTIHQTVPNGQAYNVQLWTFEAYSGNAREMSVSGDIATTNFGDLPLAAWEARTLTTGIITDGSIDFTLTNMANQPVLSGMAIFSVSAVPEAGASAMLGIVACLGGLWRVRSRRVLHGV